VRIFAQKAPMKNSVSVLFALLLLVLSAFAAIPSADWKISDGYSIAFDSEDPSGTFTKFGGTISFDPEAPSTGVFDVWVDANSISTGNGMKNKHARSDEWLDAAKYPKIAFKSSAVTKMEKGYEITGILDLHGVRKEIKIPFTFENNTFAGTFVVNRTDYNIGKTKGMSAKVSKELTIRFSVPVAQ
jgi:polyisoprenoid-binding protein YceI